MIAFESGDHEEATRRFAEVTTGANRYGALLYRGKALEALGRTSEAKRCYEEASRIARSAASTGSSR